MGWGRGVQNFCKQDVVPEPRAALPAPEETTDLLGKESGRLPRGARGREGVQYGDYYIQSLNHPKKVL